jgi:hypothetical protein
VVEKVCTDCAELISLNLPMKQIFEKEVYIIFLRLISLLQVKRYTSNRNHP